MAQRPGDELTELDSRQEPRLVKALEMVAPGTALREGLDNILHARTGGLIVAGDPEELSFLFSGGIKLDIDYSTALQRSELVTRMAVEIERYIVELGTEGRLIEMQLEETMVGTAADKAALVHDYLAQDTDEAFAGALDQIGRLPHQDLLDFGRLAELLGYDRKVNTLDYPVSPRGYRILGRIPRLPKP